MYRRWNLRQCTSTDCKKILDLWQWDSQLSKEKRDLRQDKIHLQEFRVYKVIGVILPKDVALTWTERVAEIPLLEHGRLDPHPQESWRIGTLAG